VSDFYRAFEDRFRGSRETVKERLRVYLPFVEALRTTGGVCTAFDLGCGRGEWLELMREAEVAAAGVDLDQDMLAVCRDMGLDARHDDALAQLRALAAESRDIVSGFHLAEHLPFADLQALVQEALRVLSPGGLLILETPDPDNLSVGTSSFYLDPTHMRPLPAGLLAFLPAHYGFHRVKILRLQEAPGMAGKAAPSLANVLRDAGADFAVVAQKAGPAGRVAALDAPFGREYGVTVAELAARYDAALEARLKAAEVNAQQAAARVEELLESRSWRLTAPLRWVADAISGTRKARR
jgi:O-antigen chain-terminating methyltransferase